MAGEGTRESEREARRWIYIWKVWVTCGRMNLCKCSVKMRGHRFSQFVEYVRGGIEANHAVASDLVWPCARAIGRFAMVRNLAVASTREPTLPVGTGTGDRPYLVIPPFAQYQFCISHNVLVIQFCTILN